MRTSEYIANLQMLATISKAVKQVVITAQSSKADVQAFAKQAGKAVAAKECAKVGIPCEVAKSWILG
jgi:ribosomal silencing factor RsfS